MLIGGITLGVGIVLILVTWLEIRALPLSPLLELYVAAFFLLMSGVIFAFLRNMARTQI